MRTQLALGLLALLSTGFAALYESPGGFGQIRLKNGVPLANADLAKLRKEHCAQVTEHVRIHDCEELIAPFYNNVNMSKTLDTDILSADVYTAGNKLIFSGSYEEAKVFLQRHSAEHNYTNVIYIVHGLNSGPWSMDDVRDSTPVDDDTLVILPNYNHYVNKTLMYLNFVHLVGDHCKLIRDYLMLPIGIGASGVHQNKNLTLIGHSLGGQTIGVLGTLLATENNVKPDLIVGLDAAGPIFTLLPEAVQLNPRSGKRVVSIHSSPVLGIIQRNAYVDLYINDILKTYNDCPEDSAFICNHNKALPIYKEFMQLAGKNVNLYDKSGGYSVKIKDAHDFYMNANGDDFNTYANPGTLNNTWHFNAL